MNRWSYNVGAVLLAAGLFFVNACDSTLPPLPQDAAGERDGDPGKLDGPVTKADGPVTKADGPVTKADGPVTKADGPVTKADGPVTKADGSVPPCGKEGQTIKLGQKCCSTLTPGSTGKPPSCSTIGQSFICVRCGDGKCDTTKGENSCSCPKDCKPNTVECITKGGYCVIQFKKCSPGYRLDSRVSCGGALSLNCCMPVNPIVCKSACDCTQGLMCANSKCIAGVAPVYCCAKPGCPTGMLCTNLNGTTGKCPPVSDCSKKRGVCVTQFAKCPAGYKVDPTTRCGTASSPKCCLPL